MYFKCFVRGCANTRQDAILHKFPASEKRLSKWLECNEISDSMLRCLNDGSLESIKKLLKKRYVCSKHFEKRFVTTNCRLTAEALPTLFTPDEISTGVPSDNTEYVKPQVDHNYVRRSHYDHNYSKKDPLPTDYFEPSSDGNQKENEACKQQKPYKIQVIIPPDVSEPQDYFESSSDGNQKENEECKQQEPYKIQVIIPPDVSESQGLHDVEFKLDLAAQMVSEPPNETTKPDTDGDNFGDAMKFDDIDISPLPSPLRGDSPSPYTIEPNNGNIVAVSIGATTPGPRRVSPIPYRPKKPNARPKKPNTRPKKPNTGNIVEVSIGTTTPEPQRVSLIPYRPKKPNTGHVSEVLNYTTEPSSEPRASPVPAPMAKPKTGEKADPTKNKRMRIVQRYKNLPSCCRDIYDKCKATIAKLRGQLYTAISSAKKKVNTKSFEHVTNEMPPVVRTFVRLQADMIKKKKKDKRAHRFKEDQKLLCLALYTANPAAYKFMSAIFMLPHKNTLKQFGQSNKEADKTATPAEHNDAIKMSQEAVTPVQTPDAVPERPEPVPERPDGVPERGADMPTFEDTEVSDAIAAIAPSATPALSTPAPALSTPAPALSTPTPALSTPAPALSTPTPALSTPTPALSTPTPALATPKPALATPTQALSTPTAATHPDHAELLAALKRCLPAPPKPPAAGAIPTDERGRFVRRLKRPLVKANPTPLKKPLMSRSATIRVFKLAAGTTCEDVVAHVTAIVPHHLVRCQKISTKLKGPAFVVEVPKKYRDGVLEPSFWPEGVVTWARGTALPVSEAMLKIRVFNVAEGTPVSDMVQHISQVVPEDKMTCERLESKGGGESFKITMPRKFMRIVAAPTFWPDGVGVARMRNQLNPREKRVKRENPTSLDLEDNIASKRMKHGGKFRPSAFLHS